MRSGHISLTPEKLKRLCDALRLGASRAIACQYAGIRKRTFHKWLADAETKNTSRHQELLECIEQAEAEAAVLWLQKLEKAATEGQWQAAAWKLERRHPKEYARNRLEITGPNGDAIQHEHRHTVSVSPMETHDKEKAAQILSIMSEIGLLKPPGEKPVLELPPAPQPISADDRG